MSSSELQARNSRIVVLQMIRDQKERLFGKFTDKANKADKEKAWQEIADCAHSMGVYPESRNGAYLRDTSWQNWRKRFVEKREKKQEYEKSGGRSGKKIDYDTSDLIVSEILEGREDHPRSRDRNYHHNSNSNSASNNFEDFLEIDIKEDPYSHLDGVGVGSGDEDEVGVNGEGYDGTLPSYTSGHITQRNPLELDDAESLENSIDATATSNSKAHNNINVNHQFENNIEGNKRHASKRKRSVFYDNHVDQEIGSGHCFLKEKKLQLEVELLELEKYKRRLEILKLERSLGLPPSEVTENIGLTLKDNESKT